MKNLIVLVCLLSLWSLAQAKGAPPQVSSSARGEVMANPDIAIVSGRVEVLEDSAEKAVRKAQKQLDRLVEYLLDRGVKSKDLQAAQVLVSPQWHYQRDKPRQLSGYKAHANFTAKLREISKLSSLYGGLVKSGATTLQPTQFDFSNRDELELRAIAKAVKMAKRKAQAGLEPLDQDVGEVLVLNVDTRWQAPSPLVITAMKRESAAMSSPAPRVNVGQHSIEATVSATFLIDD
jgi:uncharacterized protein YggE